MTPYNATLIAWIVWVVSWIAAAYFADRAEKRPTLGQEWLYRVVTVAGAFLLFGARLRLFAARRHWEFGVFADWTLFVVVLSGFAFAWWARIYLGRLWSSSVTKKAGHHIVDTGPYALVRHPIYTGLLLAAAATAAEQGTARGVIGVLGLALGFWIKARLEERFLREQLGPAAYDSYRRRVPMLVPFGPLG